MCLFKLYSHSELILLSQAKNELEIEAVWWPLIVFLFLFYFLLLFCSAYLYSGYLYMKNVLC